MEKSKRIVVIVSGYIVLVSIVAMLWSMAFLKGGHPPASGIVNLLILVVVCPVSMLSAAVGLCTKPQSLAGSQKQFFLMTGVSVAFATFSVVLLVLKLGLDKTI